MICFLRIMKLDTVYITINLKEETTVEEIKDIYKEAWAHNLKGVTIFRDGCSRTGILIADDEEDIETCPECGGTMEHKNSCEECKDCSYSPCEV